MSDENSQTSEAPDGASGAPDAGEIMTRAEARKLIAQRQELKATNAALQADMAAQAEELAKLRSAKPQEPQEPAIAGDMPAWAQALVEQNKALAEQVSATQAMFGEHRVSTARAAVETKVLAQVPDGNRETVKALLGTLSVDFTQPGAAADALAKLQEQHPVAMVDHTRGVQPRAPQIQPDGKIKPEYFDAFESFSDVPDVYKSAAMKDPKVFERLMGRGTGEGPRSDGLNI
jgi:hypothetical protein